MKTLLITNSIEPSKNFICQNLQRAWDHWAAEDKRRTEQNFLQESEQFKIIDTKRAYDALNELFVPEVVFVVPELRWMNDDVNEGYDIARELIINKYKNAFLQIVFLSVLDRVTLAKLVAPRNKSLVEAFPHVCLLESDSTISFRYYSLIHYKLIKHLALSNDGRLQKINHEMNSVKSNLLRDTRGFALNKADLLGKLEELSLFQQWTGRSIKNEIEKTHDAESTDNLVSIAKTIEDIIDEIKLKLDSAAGRNADSVKTPFNYRVFIIEDEREYRQFFSELFSSFYKEVLPDKNDQYLLGNRFRDFEIEKAPELIKSIGKNYDLFLLDLLYKDEFGNWLNFNGLDLYCLVKTVNPHAVRRIITSLPRGIVAKLVEVIIGETEKPHTDQVFTKKYGFDALRDSIIESIESINIACKIKEKAKTIWLPFPKEGIFKWEGMSDFVYNLVISENGDFKNLVAQAQKLFNLYRIGGLKINQIGWTNGELPNTRKEGDYLNKLKGKLANILVHRLIVLFEALKDADYKIWHRDFSISLKQVSNLSPGVNYFFTKLGFSLDRYDKEADKNAHWYKINFINLFPHEHEFIYEFKKEQNNAEQEQLLKDNYPNLDAIFRDILTDTSIYDAWEDLGLNFTPYTDDIVTKIHKTGQVHVDDFSDDMQLKHVHNFLESLLVNYSNQGIPEIVERATSWLLNEHGNFELKIEDTLTNNLINLLIQKEIDSQ